MPPRRRDFSASEASIVFVDREEPKQTFEKAVLSIPGEGCSLRTWYGVGGQGKTALARELFRISSVDVEPSYAHLRRAMLDLHGRPKTDPDRLLVWIRNGFAKAGVSFPAFDLAFAIMWQMTRGEEALPNFERAWLHRTSDALSEAVPDTVTITREFLEEFAETIPGLGFLIKRGTNWAFEKGKRAWLERTRSQLKEMYRQGELREPHELSALMPWMLAQDLNRHLADHPDDRFVLFIDEYETLMDGAGTGARWSENPFDRHMRSFIAETNGLLAIFFSREKLHWEEDPDWAADLKDNQHILGGLSEKDADLWLQKVPITDASLRAAIVSGARETPNDTAPIYPLMLDLQVEHWRNLGDNAKPEDFQVEERSFEARRQKLLERLLRDYDDAIQTVLRILALPERFDRVAFEHVVKTYNIPLAFEAFDKLKSLTLLSEDEDGWLSLHRAIADTIVQSLPIERLEKTRESLIDHFADRACPETVLDVTDETLACFSEANRLRQQFGPESYVSWLEQTSEKLDDAARSAFMETVWRSSLEFCLAELGPEHPDTATSYDHLATNLIALGRPSEAEPLLCKALELRERILGPEHPDTAASYNNLAMNLQALGRTLEAEPFYRKALELMETILGPEHPHTATSYNNLAATLSALGRALEAEPLNRKALDIRERVLGPEHPYTATSYDNLAQTLTVLDDALEAEQLVLKALDIRERVLGPEHPETAGSYESLAWNLEAQGRASEAEPLFRKALEIQEHVLGPEHPDTARTYHNLATNLMALSRISEAEPLLRKALNIRERVLGPEHFDTGKSDQMLGMLLRMLRRDLEADQLRNKLADLGNEDKS